MKLLMCNKYELSIKMLTHKTFGQRNLEQVLELVKMSQDNVFCYWITHKLRPMTIFKINYFVSLSLKILSLQNLCTFPGTNFTNINRKFTN